MLMRENKTSFTSNVIRSTFKSQFRVITNLGLLFIQMLMSFPLIAAEANTSNPFIENSNPGNTNNLQLNQLGINKKFEENTEITDTKIKADSGSLSRFSLKFNLTYLGPTLGDLSEKDQPNPEGSIGTYATSLGGAFGGRFRINKNSTLSLGTGVNFLHPFHGVDRTDINSPYISYDITNKIKNIQMRNSIGTSYITNPDFTKIGEDYSISFDQSLAYNIGESAFTLSFDTSIRYYLYNRAYKKSDKKANQWTLAFYPGIKYNISDKLNLNTSSNISFWNPRTTTDQSILWNKTITQRLGLGYAMTRDIYINPYLTLYPDNLKTDSTTFNISTSFSLL